MMKNKTIFVYDARENGTGGVAPTITGDHQNRITDYTAIALEIHDDSDAKKIPRCEDKRYRDKSNA